MTSDKRVDQNTLGHVTVSYDFSYANAPNAQPNCAYAPCAPVLFIRKEFRASGLVLSHNFVLLQFSFSMNFYRIKQFFRTYY